MTYPQIDANFSFCFAFFRVLVCGGMERDKPIPHGLLAVHWKSADCEEP